MGRGVRRSEPASLHPGAGAELHRSCAGGRGGRDRLVEAWWSFHLVKNHKNQATNFEYLAADRVAYVCQKLDVRGCRDIAHRCDEHGPQPQYYIMKRLREIIRAECGTGLKRRGRQGDSDTRAGRWGSVRDDTRHSCTSSKFTASPVRAARALKGTRLWLQPRPTKALDPLLSRSAIRTRTWPRIGTGADLAWFWGCRSWRWALEALGQAPRS
jgi:hypothetical protein